MPFVPTPDKAELTAIVEGAKDASMRLCVNMMGALSAAGQQQLVDLQDDGHRIGVEITADVYGTCLVCLVAVSSKGERRALVTIAEGSPGGSH